MADDFADLIARMKRIEANLRQLAADRQRPYLELRGDDQRRVRLGLQEDGTWGIRIWDSAGALILDETAA